MIKRKLSPFKQKLIEKKLRKRFQPRKKMKSDEDLYEEMTRGLVREENRLLRLRLLNHEEALTRLDAMVWHSLNMLGARVLRVSLQDFLGICFQRLHQNKEKGLNKYLDITNYLCSPKR